MDITIRNSGSTIPEREQSRVVERFFRPGMGGLDTCRAIRAQSDIAVIMLTVRDSDSDKVDALDAGADDYVTKPYNPPELLARIRAALRMNRNRPVRSSS